MPVSTFVRCNLLETLTPELETIISAGHPSHFVLSFCIELCNPSCSSSRNSLVINRCLTVVYTQEPMFIVILIINLKPTKESPYYFSLLHREHY